MPVARSAGIAIWAADPKPLEHSPVQLAQDPDRGVRLQLAVHLEEIETQGVPEAGEIRSRLREDSSAEVRHSAE